MWNKVSCLRKEHNKTVLADRSIQKMTSAFNRETVFSVSSAIHMEQLSVLLYKITKHQEKINKSGINPWLCSPSLN